MKKKLFLQYASRCCLVSGRGTHVLRTHHGVLATLSPLAPRAPAHAGPLRSHVQRQRQPEGRIGRLQAPLPRQEIQQILLQW